MQVGADEAESECGLLFHHHSNVFPLTSGDVFDALVADIAEHGLLEPITMLDGMVLDGRNRLRAMIKLDPGFSPTTAPKLFVEFDGDDPLEWVISKNLHRRHLNESQRALIAAKISLASPAKPPARSLAARLNVSLDSVNRAKRVIRHRPDLVEAVELGTAKVGTSFRFVLRVNVLDITEGEAGQFQAYCAGRGSNMSDVMLGAIREMLDGRHDPALPDLKPRRLGLVEAMRSDVS